MSGRARGVACRERRCGRTTSGSSRRNSGRQPGETVSIGLRVGQNFVGDPVPRLSRAFEQFVVRQGGGEQPVNGMENTDPAGFFRADGQATAIVAYRSAGSFVELPAEKFEEYLRQEGLDRHHRCCAHETRRARQVRPRALLSLRQGAADRRAAVGGGLAAARTEPRDRSGRRPDPPARAFSRPRAP